MTRSFGQSTATSSDAAQRGIASLLHLLVGIPRWARAMVPVVGMAVLWASSSRVPGNEPASTAQALFHNSMHIVAYGCLAASVWVAWSRRPVSAKHAWRSRGAWLIAVLYGVVDELHQSYVPSRVCSFSDLLSDASGAALAVVLLRVFAGVSSSWRLAAGLLVVASALSVTAATFAGW